MKPAVNRAAGWPILDYILKGFVSDELPLQAQEDQRRSDNAGSEEKMKRVLEGHTTQIKEVSIVLRVVFSFILFDHWIDIFCSCGPLMNRNCLQQQADWEKLYDAQTGFKAVSTNCMRSASIWMLSFKRQSMQPKKWRRFQLRVRRLRNNRLRSKLRICTGS
jgi:hypothetical protein